jgi:hypothetical protein
MRQEGFSSIGQTGRILAENAQNGDGKRLGRAIADVSPPAIATWLGRQAPVKMDRAAVLRASSHNVGLQIKMEGRYPENGPSYLVAVGCEVRGDQGAIDMALDDLRNFMVPADQRDIEEWLAELSVISAKRADDQFTEGLRIEAYAARLRSYPADVARSALLDHTWKFWPTWAELEKVCERLASPRRQMIRALERGPMPREPERRPPTEDEKARIAQLIAERFPSVSAEWRDRAMNEIAKGTMAATE